MLRVRGSGSGRNGLLRTVGLVDWLGAVGRWSGVSVASYSLQHPAQFCPDVLDQLRRALTAHLYHGLPVPEIHRRHALRYAGKTRVRCREAERKPVLRRWPVTVADVYLPDWPEGAADRVPAWAASIRAELDRR